jgi:hypothetical protein
MVFFKNSFLLSSAIFYGFHQCLATINHTTMAHTYTVTATRFPFLTTVGTITADPRFTTTLTAHIEPNVNTASIFSTRGDGIHGHLILTTGPEEYIINSVGNNTTMAPTPPTATPTHTDNATEAHITEGNRRHKA